MEFYNDAIIFAELSSKYREQIADKNPNAVKTLKEIKELVKFNVERLKVAFNIKLNKKSTEFDKGKGIFLISNSINTIISKQNNLKMRDLTTLNPFSTKTIDGVNILLDYSGSMWFMNEIDCIGENLQRIYAQNFLALVMIEYLKLISKNSLSIKVNTFCESSIIQEFGKTKDIDYDIFIVHKEWGSRGSSSSKIELSPTKLLHKENDFFTNEDLNTAITDSLAKFKKENIKNFITLFITDGGVHRIGETKEDRVLYIQNFMNKLQSLCKMTTTMFVFVKEQREDTAELCKKVDIDTLLLNEIAQFNSAFEHFTHTINNIKW